MKIKNQILDVLRPIRRRLRSHHQYVRMAKSFSATGFDPPVMYDVGARWGISPPYDQLKLIPGFCSVGFEADPEEAERLESAKLFTRVVPVGLGNKDEVRPLYVARDPGSSSLFEPDMKEIGRHTGSKQFETTKTISVLLTPMDSVVEKYDLPPPDFIKVDCEGAEGMIFEGAAGVLRNVIGVSFEARIVEFYRGEPRLQGLLSFFLDRGFVLVDLKPVGSFNGTQVMFDVAMIRHPGGYQSEREFCMGKLFCLLYGNAPYASYLESIGAEFRH
jgi:FkbM family methyltransferase